MAMCMWTDGVSFGTGALYGGLSGHWNAIVPGYYVRPMSKGFPQECFPGHVYNEDRVR